MPQQPIKSKVNSLASAPTPQNTPASVTNSYLKSNPLASNLPNTINEDDENELRQKLASNPAFLSMIQGKLGSLVGAKSGYIDNLPKSVKNRIYSLKSVQAELQHVEDEFQKELFELERRFLTKYSPIHEKRKQIINGELEPTEEEIAKGKEIEQELGAEDEEEEEEEAENDEEEDDEAAEKKEDEADVKGIPDFWLTALENLSQVANIITERDQEVLSYLTNIKLQYLEKPGFQLVFEFAENPYFKNSQLTKSYYYQEELGYSGDFIYDHAEGSSVDWSSTKRNVTISIERRKQRNKTTQQTRTIEKATPVDSFFNFFDPPRADEQEERDEDDEEEDDEAAEELEQRLAFDYQLGEEIKDKLIPRAIDWFTGSAIEYEGEEFDEEEFDEDDEEEGDEDDEDEDEDDEDEDEEEEGAEKKQPAECKQS